MRCTALVDARHGAAVDRSAGDEELRSYERGSKFVRAEYVAKYLMQIDNFPKPACASGVAR